MMLALYHHNIHLSIEKQKYTAKNIVITTSKIPKTPFSLDFVL